MHKKYCIDANIFIQPKNTYYAFDIAPGYWNFLDKKFQEGVIYSIDLVYKEIMAGKDELKGWIQKRNKKEYFVKPDKEVIKHFKDITIWAINYPKHEADQFLKRADPLLVAQAKADNSTVVTLEKFVGARSQKIKIPNLCREFNVECVDLFTMLRKLHAEFVLSE
ncbi:MAG: DUF4411 family protein [Candidatus Omnitrophica bacterium]|nr:DUF4411 family protein [Candidatus Omnitrophota bacterium]